MQSTPQQSKADNFKDLATFSLKLFVIWLSWKGILYVLGEESKPIEERMFPAMSIVWEDLNDKVRWFVLNGAELLLNLLGYKTENTGYYLRIQGSRGVGLGNYCLGLQLIYYFISLLIISKLTWKQKLFSSVAGIAITNVLNVFRIAVFNLVLIYSPSLLPLMHDHVFNVVVTGCLFLFYLFLIRK